MVNIPIGISNEYNVLEKSSIINKNIPPKTKLTGIATELFGPTIILTMCGTINPKSPITPVTEIIADEASVAATRTMILLRWGFNPEDWASWSPKANTLSFHRK